MDDSLGEDTGEGRFVREARVGVHVDSVERFWGSFEEMFPERSEWERGGGEKHEGDFGFLESGRSGVDSGGDSEEGVVI